MLGLLCVMCTPKRQTKSTLEVLTYDFCSRSLKDIVGLHLRKEQEKQVVESCEQKNGVQKMETSCLWQKYYWGRIPSILYYMGKKCKEFLSSIIIN